MKCVCPMGGDRTCPDNCLIAVWHSLPEDQRTKERRRPIVETLAKQGYTQQAIGIQLGVSVMTISRDIGTFNTMLNVKGQGKDTRGRKKSTGRPKGSGAKRAGPKPERRTTDAATEAAAAELVLDQNNTYEQAAAKLGLSSVQPVKTAVAREEGRREIPPAVWDSIPATAQQKIQAEINRRKRDLDAKFNREVLEEIKKRIDEIVLPSWKQKIDQAQELYKHRRGAMDKATFNKIRRALHPDSRHSISDKVLAEAFDTFMGLEKFLLNEKDSPTEIGSLPRSWDEWERAKQTATAERRAKRSGNAVRPR